MHHDEIADIRAGRGGLIPEGRGTPKPRTEIITVRLTPRDRANGVGSGGGIVGEQHDERPKYQTATARVPALWAFGGIVSTLNSESNP